MSWQPYSLDKVAQKLVLDNLDSLNESYKMRVTIAYGLERFWGEQLRGDDHKRSYWKKTWTELVKVMKSTGVFVPDVTVVIPNDPKDTNQVDTYKNSLKSQTNQLWGDEDLPNNGGRFSESDRQVTLAVLVQLCDCLVWWTQRYKLKKEGDE